MLASAIALLTLQVPANPLRSYLNVPDRTFYYREVGRTGNLIDLEIASQTWKGSKWTHRILFTRPADYKGDTGILFITGDGPRDGDRLQLSLMSGASGMPIAMLFGVPNQPIFGMREDDLIAHTFEQFLKTKDARWPLLFPMTKSAIKAMDAVEKFSADQGQPIKRFVVTGASKRGWTTWLVGASGDKRVAGIAPMVIDNLNIPAQMKHQIKSWGDYSEMIQDYTRRGLQEKMETRDGQRLTAMVDPFTYRSAIKAPVLIVNGANDRYWTVDAMSQYWDSLKMPKWARVIPNVGHDLGGGQAAIESIGAFARVINAGTSLPDFDTNLRFQDGVLRAQVRFDKIRPLSISLWVASSRTKDFRSSTWTRSVNTALEGTGKGSLELKYPWPAEPMNLATFVEMRYRLSSGRTYSLTSPVKVFARD